MKQIGVAIGRQDIEVGEAGERGELVQFESFAYPSSATPEAALEPVVEWIRGQVDGVLVRRVGIACPGPINVRTGTIIAPPAMERWWGFNIVEHLEGASGVRSILENDANLAGLAEARWGAGKGSDSVFSLRFGRGVGGAYLHEGNIFRGANDAAAEVWHLHVPDARTPIPAEWTVNARLAVGPLRRAAAERLGSSDTDEIIRALSVGDARLDDLIDEALAHAAHMISTLCAVLDPEIIVVDSPILRIRPDLLEALRQESLPLVLNPQGLRLVPSRFGSRGPLVGACLL